MAVFGDSNLLNFCFVISQKSSNLQLKKDASEVGERRVTSQKWPENAAVDLEI
jgi:hypothetical protein